MITAFPDEPPARRRLLAVLSWTWGLPNTLVSLAGLALALAGGGEVRPFRGAVVVRVGWMRWFGGVCLGPVILVAPGMPHELVLHEWGHFRQHLRLGPLYFLVVGLPSVTHALWFRLRPRGSYFHFYTEAWADALGGVYALHGHLHPRWTGYAVKPSIVVLFVAAVAWAVGALS